LYQEGYDKAITNVYGTSIGAYFAALFALHIPTEEIEEWFSNLPEDFISFNFTDVMNLYDKLGLNSGDTLLDFLTKYAHDMTFLDFAKKTGKNMVLCATHLNTMKPTYFSVELTPNVCVVDAVKASMAFPFLFEPVKIGDDLYIDGGVTNNLAIKMIPDSVPKNEILILNMCSKMTGDAIVDFNVPRKDYSMLLTYVINIYNTILNNNQSHLLLQKIYPYYILIENIPLASMSIHLKNDVSMMKLPSKQDIDNCFSIGYRIMYDLYANQKYSPLSIENTESHHHPDVPDILAP
jgi:predicted patatin/cPLA2 family phospholipase